MWTDGDVVALNPDHRLLLDSVTPLLRSDSPAVIIAVVSVFRYLAPTSEWGKVAAPLLRLLRSSREITNVALNVRHERGGDTSLRRRSFCIWRSLMPESSNLILLVCFSLLFSLSLSPLSLLLPLGSICCSTSSPMKLPIASLTLIPPQIFSSVPRILRLLVRSN